MDEKTKNEMLNLVRSMSVYCKNEEALLRVFPYLDKKEVKQIYAEVQQKLKEKAESETKEQYIKKHEDNVVGKEAFLKTYRDSVKEARKIIEEREGKESESFRKFCREAISDFKRKGFDVDSIKEIFPEFSEVEIYYCSQGSSSDSEQ